MRRWLLPGFAGALAIACAAGSDDEAGDSANQGPGTGSGANASGGSTGSGNEPLPPEQELEETFRAPVVSGRWVWTANPDTGRVALIDTASLDVTTADAELGPTYLAALPSASEEESAALVINTGTDRLSILHASAGVIESQAVDIHHGANSLEVAPSGELCVVWTNAALVTSPDPTEGFQDVTVAMLGAEPTSQRLTVGYRPSRVFISADESLAFVVAESTISVIDLAGDGAPAVLRDVALGADPNEAAAARDVTVTPSGTHALVLHAGSAVVDIIDLGTGEKVGVTLPGPVTDLDLSADASRAFAVVRGQLGEPSGAAGAGAGGASAGAGNGGEGGAAIGAGGDGGGAVSDGGMGGAGGASGVVGGGSGGTSGGEGGSGAVGAPENSLLVVLPLPDVLSSPSAYQVIELEQFAGSIALDDQDRVALLYTNAVASDRLTIVDMVGVPSEWGLRTVLVKAPIQAVFPAPDGAHAVVFMGQAAGSSLPGGYSIVPLGERLPPKIVGTVAPPKSIAIGPSPSRNALVTVSNDVDLHEVHLLHMPELSSDVISLPSAPLSAGIVPETQKGFVAQRHPEGRLTFVELESGAPRTLTGFELSEKVHDGSE